MPFLVRRLLSRCFLTFWLLSGPIPLLLCVGDGEEDVGGMRKALVRMEIGSVSDLARFLSSKSLKYFLGIKYVTWCKVMRPLIKAEVFESKRYLL